MGSESKTYNPEDLVELGEDIVNQYSLKSNKGIVIVQDPSHDVTDRYIVAFDSNVAIGADKLSDYRDKGWGLDEHILDKYQDHYAKALYFSETNIKPYSETNETITEGDIVKLKNGEIAKIIAVSKDNNNYLKLSDTGVPLSSSSVDTWDNPEYTKKYVAERVEGLFTDQIGYKVQPLEKTEYLEGDVVLLDSGEITKIIAVGSHYLILSPKSTVALALTEYGANTWRNPTYTRKYINEKVSHCYAEDIVGSLNDTMPRRGGIVGRFKPPRGAKNNAENKKERTHKYSVGDTVEFIDKIATIIALDKEFDNSYLALTENGSLSLSKDRADSWDVDPDVYEKYKGYNCSIIDENVSESKKVTLSSKKKYDVGDKIKIDLYDSAAELKSDIVTVIAKSTGSSYLVAINGKYGTLTKAVADYWDVDKDTTQKYFDCDICSISDDAITGLVKNAPATKKDKYEPGDIVRYTDGSSSMIIGYGYYKSYYAGQQCYLLLSAGGSITKLAQAGDYFVLPKLKEKYSNEMVDSVLHNDIEGCIGTDKKIKNLIKPTPQDSYEEGDIVQIASGQTFTLIKISGHFLALSNDNNRGIVLSRSIAVNWKLDKKIADKYSGQTVIELYNEDIIGKIDTDEQVINMLKPEPIKQDSYEEGDVLRLSGLGNFTVLWVNNNKYCFASENENDPKLTDEIASTWGLPEEIKNKYMGEPTWNIPIDTGLIEGKIDENVEVKNIAQKELKKIKVGDYVKIDKTKDSVFQNIVNTPVRIIGYDKNSLAVEANREIQEVGYGGELNEREIDQFNINKDNAVKMVVFIQRDLAEEIITPDEYRQRNYGHIGKYLKIKESADEIYKRLPLHKFEIIGADEDRYVILSDKSNVVIDNASIEKYSINKKHWNNYAFFIHKDSVEHVSPFKYPPISAEKYKERFGGFKNGQIIITKLSLKGKKYIVVNEEVDGVAALGRLLTDDEIVAVYDEDRDVEISSVSELKIGSLVTINYDGEEFIGEILDRKYHCDPAAQATPQWVRFIKSGEEIVRKITLSDIVKTYAEKDISRSVFYKDIKKDLCTGQEIEIRIDNTVEKAVMLHAADGRTYAVLVNLVDARCIDLSDHHAEQLNITPWKKCAWILEDQDEILKVGKNPLENEVRDIHGEVAQEDLSFSELRDIFINNEVDWNELSKYEKLSEGFIREFAEYVNWHYISESQNLSSGFVREFEDSIKWDYCSRNTNIDDDFIRKYSRNLNWGQLSAYQNLSEDFIREFKHKINWGLLSANKTFSADFVREFKDYVNWHYVSKWPNLSEEFLIEFSDKLDFLNASMFQNLSEDFLEMFKDKINWQLVSQYQNLSEKFIRKYRKHINWDTLKLNDKIQDKLKNKNHFFSKGKDMSEWTILTLNAEECNYDEEEANVLHVVKTSDREQARELIGHCSCGCETWDEPATKEGLERLRKENRLPETFKDMKDFDLAELANHENVKIIDADGNDIKEQYKEKKKGNTMNEKLLQIKDNVIASAKDLSGAGALGLKLAGAERMNEAAYSQLRKALVKMGIDPDTADDPAVKGAILMALPMIVHPLASTFEEKVPYAKYVKDGMELSFTESVRGNSAALMEFAMQLFRAMYEASEEIEPVLAKKVRIQVDYDKYDVTGLKKIAKDRHLRISGKSKRDELLALLLEADQDAEALSLTVD